jgi:hypothetical protein
MPSALPVLRVSAHSRCRAANRLSISVLHESSLLSPVLCFLFFPELSIVLRAAACWALRALKWWGCHLQILLRRFGIEPTMPPHLSPAPLLWLGVNRYTTRRSRIGHLGSVSAVFVIGSGRDPPLCCHLVSALVGSNPEWPLSSPHFV